MTPSQPRPDPRFEALLEYLKRNRSFDFTGYKRSTLMRRVEKRMRVVEVDDYAAYTDYLEVHPDEFAHLFDTILINVTSFFRDPDAWDAVKAELATRFAENGAPVRVWSAGCASGEETYTLVMVLCELLGMEGFRERVKVYATDVDGAALGEARAAVYDEKALAGLPEGYAERYFEQVAGKFVFRNDLRRFVIFGRHDLVQDAPISHLDLLVCRNTLMYFNAEIQSRILARFHFGLGSAGLLFLGKAEMMRSHASLFSPVDLKARLFAKLPRAAMRDRMLMIGQGTQDAVANRVGFQLRLRDAALDAEPAARVVVDVHGNLALANQPARVLFALSNADMGRPLRDLTLSYRPVELRSRVEQVTTERRPVSLNSVEHVTPEGEIRSFDVQITPLMDDQGVMLGVSAAFVDVTRYLRLQSDLEGANQELETAYEELQSTNEELETTNEELQSTIEELETTNEELQSTNEELETMNEELQSTNEELETINDELRRRTDELNNVNAYMTSILTSLRIGVVVLDRDMCVRVWNRKAEDLWGLRQDEVVSQSVLALDIGLPVDRLKATIRAALEGRTDHQEVVVDATNRRGRAIHCRVTGAPLMGLERDIRGVVLLMEEWDEGRTQA
jgi:two-component system CheB/CheR fusion protein